MRAGQKKVGNTWSMICRVGRKPTTPPRTAGQHGRVSSQGIFRTIDPGGGGSARPVGANGPFRHNRQRWFRSGLDWEFLRTGALRGCYGSWNKDRINTKLLQKQHRPIPHQKTEWKEKNPPRQESQTMNSLWGIRNPGPHFRGLDCLMVTSEAFWHATGSFIRRTSRTELPSATRHKGGCRHVTYTEVVRSARGLRADVKKTNQQAALTFKENGTKGPTQRPAFRSRTQNP